MLLVQGFRPLTGIAKGSVCSSVELLDTLWLLLKFGIYMVKNIHSYLPKAFSEAHLGQHLCHVGSH